MQGRKYIYYIAILQYTILYVYIHFHTFYICGNIYVNIYAYVYYIHIQNDESLFTKILTVVIPQK